MESSKKLTKILFFTYLVVLVWIIVFKGSIPFTELGYMRNVNLEPFQAPARINGQVDYSEMILNMIIFVPYGIYIGMLIRQWNPVQKILLFFTTSLAFEIVQYILAVGASDITDIINNTLGGIVGLIIFWILKITFQDKNKAYMIMNTLALIGTIITIILLLLL